MFNLVEEAFQRYYKNPSTSDFVILIFLLYHLRELVVGGQNYKEIEKIDTKKRTSAQRLFSDLWGMDEFQTIREICNGSKHHKISRKLMQVNGFRCGLSRCGDHLGQRYFLIDGSDSRIVFAPVVKKYKNFFKDNAGY